MLLLYSKPPVDFSFSQSRSISPHTGLQDYIHILAALPLIYCNTALLSDSPATLASWLFHEHTTQLPLWGFTWLFLLTGILLSAWRIPSRQVFILMLLFHWGLPWPLYLKLQFTLPSAYSLPVCLSLLCFPPPTAPNIIYLLVSVGLQ